MNHLFSPYDHGYSTEIVLRYVTVLVPASGQHHSMLVTL